MEKIMIFLYQIELPKTLIIIHNSTQSEIDNNNIHWTLENSIQSVETQESGWNFQRINTKEISFYKSRELIGSSFVKSPSRNSAFITIKKDDNNCFI